MTRTQPESESRDSAAAPLVNLITPTYNCGQYIPRLLDSVLRQTHPRIEMFVVDDGSTDGTEEIIRRYMRSFRERDYELHYDRQENQGQSVAVNRALKRVNGDYLAWPDADDFYKTPDAIAALVAALENGGEETGMSRCLAEYLDSENFRVEAEIPRAATWSERLFEDCLFKTNGFWYCSGGYLARVSALKKTIPGLDIYTERRAGQNWQLLLPVLHKYKCATVPRVLYSIVCRTDSHSRVGTASRKHVNAKLDSYCNTLLGTLERMPDMPALEKAELSARVIAKYAKLKRENNFRCWTEPLRRIARRTLGRSKQGGRTGSKPREGARGPSGARMPLACFAARTRDDAVLKASSSGGVFTELARQILSKGGVVAGAAWNRKTWQVEHRVVRNEEELAELRGSKYVYSHFAGVLGELEICLAEGKPVLFSGVPCQVAAARRRLRDAEGLLTCGVICHSGIDEKIWLRYVAELENGAHSRLTDVHFRDKSDGWGQSRIALEFEEPRKNYSLSWRECPYCRAFTAGFAAREACLSCRFRAGRAGMDILLGDFWGIEKHLPDWADARGASAVLIYGERGLAAWNALDIEKVPVSYTQISEGNPMLERCMEPDEARRACFLAQYDRLGVAAAFARAMKEGRMRRLWCRLLQKGWGMVKKAFGV